MDQHDDQVPGRWPPPVAGATEPAVPDPGAPVHLDRDPDLDPGPDPDPGPWSSVPQRPVAPAAGRPRRRWPWAVALVLVAGVAGVAVAVASDQRDVAAEWRERAVAVEAQFEQVVGRGEALELQLEEVAQLLDISESDVADLEGRIRELADEKAQAEDTATTVQVERDVFVDLSARIVDATDALDACVSRLFDLQAASVDAFNRTTAGEPVDVEPLNAQARETTAFCNDARTAAAGASAAAEQLLRP